MIRVDVTPGDIAAGVPGDSYACAIAMAVQRAIGDDGAHLFESGDGVAHISSGGRCVTAPHVARRWMWAFDDQPRRADGRVDMAHEDYEPMAPIAFDLPDLSACDWRWQCCQCEEMSDEPTDAESMCLGCSAGRLPGGQSTQAGG